LRIDGHHSERQTSDGCSAIKTGDTASDAVDPKLKEATMDTLGHSRFHELVHDGESTESETYTPSYELLMHEPTMLLAGNPADRTDVATAAILGYN
jgi:hypothetical protein